MTNEFAETTLLMADRATLFRHGLRGLLREHRPDWSCADAGTLDEVVAHLSVEPVDLVLFDLQLGGIPALRRLRQDFPHQPIMVLADSDNRATILECLMTGAHGYALKSASWPQLLRAIETVLSGGVFAPAALAGVAPPAPAAQPIDSARLSRLTERQVDVFRLLSEGCATKTIARRLGLAVGTVKVHLAAIYRVLGARNRVEALAKANGEVARAAPSTRTVERLVAEGDLRIAEGSKQDRSAVLDRRHLQSLIAGVQRGSA